MAKRRYYRKVYQQSKIKLIFFLILKILFSFLFISFLIFIFLFLYCAKDLPRPEKFIEKELFQSTKIYDRTGEILLYSIYGEEKRITVSLDKIPDHLKKAVIVAEDANFYQHQGIDLKAIGRAILIDLKLKEPLYGGSTIPQQLIRSSFLTREKTIKRKFREIILTLELERRYSKEQILEWYLNQIPFGQNCYGVEAASQTYFKKSVSDISLSEAVILAALIKSPSYLSPYEEHKDELLKRKDYLIKRMVQNNYLKKEEAEIAKEEEVKFEKILNPIKAPHFTLYVKEYLENIYGRDFLEREGLKIYTTLDWQIQKLAQDVLEKGIENNKPYKAFNGALVVIDPKTGEILAMVGSKNYFSEPYPSGCRAGIDCLFDPQFNAAISLRQPGSAFKPFAYIAAFEKGFTPDTVVWDVKTEFNLLCSYKANQEKDKYGSECYHPKNYDRKFRGPITLRTALAQSINVPSVKVLYLAGLEKTIETAKKMGVLNLKEPSYYGLSLVLGGGEVSLLDMVSAYGVLSNDGLQIPKAAILKIENKEGNIIEENRKTPKRILEKEVVRNINDILSDNESRAPMFGWNSFLYFKDFKVAAKTGTTQNFRDAWTIGYTPSIVTGVWVGNNNNSPMSEMAGVFLAGPIFHNLMEKLLTQEEKETFPEPKKIVTKKPVLNGETGEHNILYYVDKANPQGERPIDPSRDFQYENWEKAVLDWKKLNLF